MKLMPGLSGRGERAYADATTIEPSEAKIRSLLRWALLLFGPIALLLLYYRIMFPGLTTPDALDYAQLGRNLSAGRGFTTYVLRPLALTHGQNPLQQPDVTHGPLFPFLLALVFGASKATDSVVAGVSGFFYLLTIPVLYQLGRRMFAPNVGMLAALVFTINGLHLEYAASGLPITLCIFLVTSLFLSLFLLAERMPARDASDTPLPRLPLVLTAGLTGFLYLTDPLFFWLIPVVFGAALWLNPGRRGRAALVFLVALGIVVLPWMTRNFLVTGNPVFGLRGAELWMNTRAYPGSLAYRLLPGDLTFNPSLLHSVVGKILYNANLIIRTFPQVSGSWILAFFLPSLLFRFTAPAANHVRRLTLYCFLGLFVEMLLFSVQMPLFVSMIPAMLVFSVAYLLYLIQQAQLPRPSVAVIVALIAFTIVFPLVSDLTIIDKPVGIKTAGAARTYGRNVSPETVCLSDQPWIPAWYGDRPAVWLPALDDKVTDIRERLDHVQRLFLTEQTRSYSRDWQYVYETFQRWNDLCLEARENQTTPPPTISITGNERMLLKELVGFTSVDPAQNASTVAVVAALPETNGEKRP